MASKLAGDILDVWIGICHNQTGIANVWSDASGEYLWEIDSKPFEEGGLSGIFYTKNQKNGRFQRSGIWQISKSGTMIAAPPPLFNLINNN